MSFGEFFAKTAVKSFAAGTTTAVMRGGRVAVQQVAVDAFGNAAGTSLAEMSSGASNPSSALDYRNGSDIASDSYSPAFNYAYRNEMDRASDAYNPASAYGYRNGLDVQSDAFNPAALANYRNGMDVASDNFNPASLPNYRNGMDVASDNFNPASLPNYRNGLDALSDQAYTARRRVPQPGAPVNALVDARSSNGGDLTAYDTRLESSRFANARRDILPAQARMADLALLGMRGDTVQGMPASFWDAKAQEYKDTTLELGQRFARDGIYNGFKANAILARQSVTGDDSNHMAGVLIESGAAAAVGTALATRSLGYINGPVVGVASNRPATSSFDESVDASLPIGSKRLQLNQPDNPSYQPIRNEPGAVSGRNYSGHAFDRMQDRGIMPSVIENTVKVGVTTPSRFGSSVHYDPVNNLTVVVNAQGKVITVMHGGR